MGENENNNAVFGGVGYFKSEIFRNFFLEKKPGRVFKLQEVIIFAIGKMNLTLFLNFFSNLIFKKKKKRKRLRNQCRVNRTQPKHQSI